MSENEDYMAAARSEANKSKDNETKVGAVIVNIKNKIIGTGYNCMPMGRNDDNENFPWLARKMARPNDKYGIASEHKHLYVCHAELNAIVNACKSGKYKDLQDSTIYVTLNPCNECAKLIAQVGIKKVYYDAEKNNKDEYKAARKIFEATSIDVKQHSNPKKKSG